jgi:aerotaxis receptor
MRNNQPVTMAETIVPDDEFIYSRTNLKGVIEEANEAFARISGYTREEMIGQPHNLVRHPEMPEAAFADLWADLAAGRPWRGLVKNRRKDGGYYWVVANASPVREHGQIVGYQSVRARPTRQETAAAEDAYRRIRQGDKSLRIEHGRIVRVLPGGVEWFARLPTQMLIMGLLAILPGLLALLASLTESPLFDRLDQVLSAIAALYALFFLFWVAPRAARDLAATANYLESVLATGDLKTRLRIDRHDIIGHVARLADRFIASMQATVQGMADSSEAGRRTPTAIEVRRRRARRSTGRPIETERSHFGGGRSRRGSHRLDRRGGRSMRVQYRGRRRTSTGAKCRARRARSDRCEASATIPLAGRRRSRRRRTAGRDARPALRAEISHIVAVRSRRVADQTNLLALNAAIEAARAGEAGARLLRWSPTRYASSPSAPARATQEITLMIGSIQSETRQAVDGMRSGAHEVEESVRLVQEAREALRGINEQMSTTVAMVSEITHSSSQQQAAMTELAQNVERVALMTDENVAVTRQTEAMVDSLSATVRRMRKAVEQYRV